MKRRAERRAKIWTDEVSSMRESHVRYDER